MDMLLFSLNEMATTVVRQGKLKVSAGMHFHMKNYLFAILVFTRLSAFAEPDFNRFAFTLETKEKNEISHSGTGCLVKSGDAVFYVSAHHIFSDMSDPQRTALLKKMSIVNEANNNVRFAPDAVVPVANVVDLTKTDLMVFKMKPNSAMTSYVISLAPTAPLKDEMVYLSSRLPGRSIATYPLKVLTADNERMEYVKIPGVEKYTGASGGPILNAKGQLVGTYLGRSLNKANKNDILCLLGTPLASLTAVMQPTK